MTIDLSGRTALVTGASRGIGTAVARQLAAAGATVGVHYGSNRAAAEALAAALGNGSAALGADLADPHAAQTLWTDAVNAFGRIDILVANAGVFVEAPLEGPLEPWLAAWDKTLDINLKSCAVLARAACLHAKVRQAAGEEGIVVRVVTVSSRAAFRGDDPDYLAYAASKGGLVALTKSIARGWGRNGVVAFGVAPGFTRTDMAQPYIDEFGLEKATAGAALDQLTEPEDVAPTIVFLASGLADHATGTTVDINAATYVR